MKHPPNAPYMRPVDTSRGAPMGRPTHDGPPVSPDRAEFREFYAREYDEQAEPMHLRRVPLHGDYDPGGAYWGGAAVAGSLYCAWNHARTYWTRAHSRKAAAANIRAQHPGIPAWKVNP